MAKKSIDLVDYGGDNTGARDSTAALQSAIDDIIGRGDFLGPGPVHMTGKYLIDPARLDLTHITENKTIILKLHGLLRVNSTFELPAGFHIHGTGGAGDVQFGTRAKAIVLPGPLLPSTHPLIQMVGIGGRKSLKNLVINAGPQHNGPALQLGYPLGHAIQAQSALFALDNISIRCGDNDNATCITTENAYWVWLNDFNLSGRANAKAVIHFADSYDPGPGNNSSGLFYANTGTFTVKGILIEGIRSNTPGSIYFKGITFESPRTSFVRCNHQVGVDDLTLSACSFADTHTPDIAYIEGQQGFIKTASILNWSNFDNRPWFKGPVLPTRTHVDQLSRTNVAGQTNLFDPYPRKPLYFYDGEIEGSLAFRDGGMQPVYVPEDVTVFPVDDPSEWVLAESLSLNSSVVAPDGSNTAHEVVETSSGEGTKTAKVLEDTVVNFGINPGDYILFGAWLRIADFKTVLQFHGKPMRLNISGISGAKAWHDSPNHISEPSFDMANDATRSWIFISHFSEYVGSGAAGALSFKFIFRGIDSGMRIWRPFCAKLPGAVYTVRDAARMRSVFSGTPQNVGRGVLTMQSHQTFATGNGMRGDRPDAATVGTGAQWYDKTLGQPIWSNGILWRNANGDIV